MEKQKSMRKVLAGVGGLVVFVAVCILAWPYIEKKPPFFSKTATVTVEDLPEPDRIIINVGPENRDFSNWEEGEKEAVYEKGSEEYEELFELTAARWKKTYRKGELSEEEELMTYAHRWSSEPVLDPARGRVGLLMFFEYDDPVLWNKNNMKTAEALVFRPEYQEGTAADYQGEFSVQCDGRFLDAGSAYAYYYTEELVKAAERLAP